MNMSEKHYAVVVSILSSPAHNNVWRLLGLGTPSSVYERIAFDKNLQTQDFIAKKYSSNPIEAAKEIIDMVESGSINIVSYWDSEYPALLKEIHRPPIVLYTIGEINRAKSIAVVGTRRSDNRSAANARRISGSLAAEGYNIVSGMAIGIDREAHIGAINSNGATIGVLANGIDIVYPKANRDLYCKIESSPGSGLISEYPPGIYAGKWTFVRRNRIISGLCLGTVVVKAGSKSGALITAKYALEQNREVFACCGHSFDEDYSGCHDLIRNGAVLVSKSEDIFIELSGFRNNMIMPLPKESDIIVKENNQDNQQKEYIDISDDNITANKILNLLSSGDYDIDSIIRKIEDSPNRVNEAIVLLEIKGIIMRNGNYISKL